MMKSLTVGDKVIIRTLVFHYIGQVAELTDLEVILEDASWLAESARWHETLATGKVVELEPYPYGVAIMRNTIVDYSPWRHDLPREAI